MKKMMMGNDIFNSFGHVFIMEWMQPYVDLARKKNGDIIGMDQFT